MAAIGFDTLKVARRLKAAGFPEKQAETQAEIMAEAFVFNLDALVTKDFLKEHLDARFAEVDGKLRLVMWMLAVVIASTVIPAVHKLLA